MRACNTLRYHLTAYAVRFEINEYECANVFIDKSLDYIFTRLK